MMPCGAGERLEPIGIQSTRPPRLIIVLSAVSRKTRSTDRLGSRDEAEDEAAIEDIQGAAAFDNVRCSKHRRRRCPWSRWKRRSGSSGYFFTGGVTGGLEKIARRAIGSRRCRRGDSGTVCGNTAVSPLPTVDIGILPAPSTEARRIDLLAECRDRLIRNCNCPRIKPPCHGEFILPNGSRSKVARFQPAPSAAAA
jgi:hypothetical protein